MTVPGRAAGVAIRLATDPAEVTAAAALRRAVFCDEQGLFTGDDRDAIDAVAMPIVAVSGGAVVGTVRIHEASPRIWWGSRLAVAASHRRVGGIGAGLVRLAVSTANAIGCDRFLAHVQTRNSVLFRRLRWHALEEVSHHGVPHVKMEAELAAFPPIAPPAATVPREVAQ